MLPALDSKKSSELRLTSFNSFTHLRARGNNGHLRSVIINYFAYICIAHLLGSHIKESAVAPEHGKFFLAASEMDGSFCFPEQ